MTRLQRLLARGLEQTRALFEPVRTLFDHVHRVARHGDAQDEADLLVAQLGPVGQRRPQRGRVDHASAGATAFRRTRKRLIGIR